MDQVNPADTHRGAVALPPAPFSAADLPAWRRLFPSCERYAYFNHAGVAPLSTWVRDAVVTSLDDVLAHGIGHENGWELAAERTRQLCATLVGAESRGIAFVRNTSHGLSLFAEGLDWQLGDEVAVCRAVEYPSNIYPWEHLGSRGVRVVDIPSDGFGVTPAAVERVLSPRTRVVALSAVQYTTGQRTDLEALGSLCRERGVLLCVDGIQQVGAVPLDVRRAGIACLSADSHKWMLGPSGIGFAYFDPQIIGRLRPSLVGWKSTTGAWNFDQAAFTLRDDAGRFEEGSPAYALIAGLGAAVELLLRAGPAEVATALGNRCDELRVGLTALGLRVGPSEGSLRAGIVTAAYPDGRSVEPLARALKDADVVASVRRGQLRLSPHFYTSPAEVRRVVEVVGAAVPLG